ncbi:hypothetical protein KP509_09G065500 [Ceratopteris richardii]|uniref:Auxin-responsive protein n=1 Tax=Ceratopteris richardii TaxID=49495 RepID=A0A8T2U3C3_CERRI|nr:hypothetical protein KP509_09G065500 [Ceratopteris richardii]
MALMHEGTRYASNQAVSQVCVHETYHQQSRKVEGTARSTKTITLFGSQLSLTRPAVDGREKHEQPSTSSKTSDLKNGFSSYEDVLQLMKIERTSKSFIKVGMDGIPFMRKIQIRGVKGYHSLALHLQKLFGLQKLELQGLLRFIGGEHGQLSVKELQNLHCILAYMDTEGDWMLVGDIPWELFIQSVQRIYIVRGKNVLGT